MTPRNQGNLTRLGRTSGFRKVWSRWLQSNGGTLDDARVMLGRSSADTTAKHYVGNSQTESQRAMAGHIGLKHLQDIYRISDELKSKLEDLEKLFGDLPHFIVHKDGNLTWPYMDGDDDQLMYIPDEIDTSGFRSKSASEGQFSIINRLRNLLIDLSSEALRDMSIGRNNRAKRLLEALVNCTS
mgnify:CR=1 FL=1